MPEDAEVATQPRSTNNITLSLPFHSNGLGFPPPLSASAQSRQPDSALDMLWQMAIVIARRPRSHCHRSPGHSLPEACLGQSRVRS